MARFAKPLQVPKIVVGLDIIPNIGHAGVSYINGPLVVGAPIVPTAALAINLPTVPSVGAYSVQQNAIGLNIISPTTGFIVTAPASILNGTLTTNGIKVTNGTKTTNGLDTKNGLSVKNDVAIGNGKKIENSGQITNGGTVLNGGAVINGGLVVNGTIQGVASGNKPISSFDIPHWKKKNTRIRHIVTEGPEPGIYVRGKIKGNTIDLPEYWDGLVDPETITVTLTAFGRAQNLYVKEIQYGRRVIIANEDGSMPDCHYEVWVARWLDPRDHSKELHVTYEGESPADYPGDSKDFLVGGWDYDRRETQWYPDSPDGVTPPVDTDPET